MKSVIHLRKKNISGWIRSYLYQLRLRQTRCIAFTLVSRQLKNTCCLLLQEIHYMNTLHRTTPWASGNHFQPYTLLPHESRVLPPSALHTTTPMGFRYYHLQPSLFIPLWASGITTFNLTYYYPHGLQVLPPSALPTTTPMGFRYYHLQPYLLLPHGLQVLPPSAIQPNKSSVYPSILYSWVSVFVQLWDSVFFCGREAHGHFICG